MASSQRWTASAGEIDGTEAAVGFSAELQAMIEKPTISAVHIRMEMYPRRCVRVPVDIFD